MTRREMREHCFKILFGVEFYPTEEINVQVEQYFDAPQEDDVADDGKEEVLHNVDMKEVDRTFLTDRVEGIAGKIPELDARIDEVAQGWKTGRMGKVELTILRQALYEMLYDSEVPSKVAINEAVELAKMFGGDDSGSFVNGILGKIASGKKDSGEAPKRRRPTHQAKIIIRSSKKDAPKSETKAEPEENSDN